MSAGFKLGSSDHLTTTSMANLYYLKAIKDSKHWAVVGFSVLLRFIYEPLRLSTFLLLGLNKCIMLQILHVYSIH